MSRRRLSLAAYVRRRWRVVGTIVVLLLGSLLVLGVTDRGHDPLWQARAEELDSAAIAPDASAAYALLREDGNLSRIVAFRGSDGSLVWEGRLNATRALLAAGPHGAAVATDFPGQEAHDPAFLTVYGADGSIQWQLPLEGNPVAMRIEGDRLALALNAPHNPVFLFERELLLRTFHHTSPVRALDMRDDLVAVAGLGGEVVVRRIDGQEILNVTLAMSPRSLRLSDDGAALVLGGYGATPADPRGHVAFLDVGSDPPVRWLQETPVGVGLVDIDATGLRVLAVEDSPPSATLHVYDGAKGGTEWTRLVSGSVSRDDAGIFGGAALSPDGDAVAVATVRGDVQLLDARTGDDRWSYRASGASFVSFASGEPHRLAVGGRLLENRPFDSVLLFAAGAEPLTQRAGLLAGALVTLAGASLALVVGLGFYRARHPY